MPTVRISQESLNLISAWSEQRRYNFVPKATTNADGTLSITLDDDTIDRLHQYGPDIDTAIRFLLGSKLS